MFELLNKKYNRLFLTKKELANELNISAATLNRQLKSDTLNIGYTVIGGQYRFSLKSLANYLEAVEMMVP
ncbi:MAG: hypothetical protein C0627_03450 [Sulfurimonas sp.]|nr:MAG: hypothetical protein C0627_03450 [Sulfurimonas sp.]